MAIVALWLLIFYLLPSTLPLEQKDYVSGTLREVYLETYQYQTRKSYRTIQKERLVLVTIDRFERKFYLTEKLKKYWDEFLKPESIDKYMHVYLDATDKRENPVEIILDGEVIYTKSDWLLGNWSLIVLLVVALIVIFNHIRK